MADHKTTTTKRDTEFRESLAATMPLATGNEEVTQRSSVGGTVIWLATVIVVGIVVGLAIRPQVVEITAAVPGVVAVVSDPPAAIVLSAKNLAEPVSVSSNLATFELGSAAIPSKLAITAPALTGTHLQVTLAVDSTLAQRDINSLQPDFSSYGMQGSVGIPAAR